MREDASCAALAAPMRGSDPSGKATWTARMVRSERDRLCSWRDSTPSRAPHTLTTEPLRMLTWVLRLPYCIHNARLSLLQCRLARKGTVSIELINPHSTSAWALCTQTGKHTLNTVPMLHRELP